MLEKVEYFIMNMKWNKEESNPWEIPEFFIAIVSFEVTSLC